MTTITEDIWRDHHARLLAFIRARVSDPNAAEDILQDIFVKIQKGLYKIKDKERILAWIFTIARNTIIDYYRSHKNMGELPEMLASLEVDNTEKERKEISRCMVPMIEKLPAHYRTAMMLSEVEGLTQRALAESESISLSGAKSRVQRGRVMLKEMLLNCCNFEFDHKGKMVSYDTKNSGQGGTEDCDGC